MGKRMFVFPPPLGRKTKNTAGGKPHSPFRQKNGGKGLLNPAYVLRGFSDWVKTRVKAARKTVSGYAFLGNGLLCKQLFNFPG